MNQKIILKDKLYQLLGDQVTSELFNISFEKQRRNTEAFNITCKYSLIYCGLGRENLN